MIENSLKGALQTNPQQVIDWVKNRLHQENYQGKKIVLIIPDATRSAPIGLMFKAIYEAIGD